MRIIPKAYLFNHPAQAHPLTHNRWVKADRVDEAAVFPYLQIDCGQLAGRRLDPGFARL